MVLLVAIVVLGSLSAALFLMATTSDRETRGTHSRVAALYAAEAGLAEAAELLRAEDGRDRLDALTYPRRLADVSYEVDVTYGDTDATLQDDLVRLVGSARHGTEEVHVELVLREELIESVGPGAFGDEAISLDNTAYVDSYDSTLGTWESQATNAKLDRRRIVYMYANSDAPSGSNGDIELTRTAAVYGDATPGPTGSVLLDGDCTVTGSTTPSDDVVELPPVVAPVLAATGALSVSGGVEVLAPGEHHFGSILVESGGTLVIRGPAVIVVGNMTIQSNSIVQADPTGGRVEIVVKNRLELLSDSSIAPTTLEPFDLSVRVAAAGVQQRLSNGTAFIGTLYAPQSPVLLENRADLRGSVVGSRLSIVNGACVHVDSALSGAGTGERPTFVPIAWRRISPDVAAALIDG